MKTELLGKLDNLKACIRELGSVAVAFSSGVDSTFLLKVAHDVLGDNAIAVTVKAGTFPENECDEAVRFCEKEGIKQFICELNPLNIEGFEENLPDRCYICKKVIFREIIKIAAEQGITNIIEGSNMDDNGDYRPGLKAIKELDIPSPLQMAELSKEEIRNLSKMFGLDTWNKPSKACLASRFVYGEKITEEKLQMVERAEGRLIESGFVQNRVRIHGMMARIEILPEQMEQFMKKEMRESIFAYFKELGFSYVTLDVAGFRSGSMNEIL